MKWTLLLTLLFSFGAFAESFCISHKGSFKAAPGNSLASLQAALDLDADGVEFDIRHTKDDVAILMHDQTLTTAVSLPQKNCPLKINIRDLTLSEIRENCALKFQDEYHPIPTLDEALSLVAPSGKFVFVELKDQPSALTQTTIQNHFTHDSQKLRIIAFKVKHLDTLITQDDFWSQVKALDLDVAPWGTPKRYGVNIWNRLFNLNAKRSLRERETSVWTLNKEKRIEMFLKKKVTFITTDEVEMCQQLKAKIIE
jgi:glycerophosphoryl diester phosphodiesterase